MTEITLLDGSIGQELVKRAPENPSPLWSTQVMIDHPEYVTEVHRDYINAGASIMTTNTYPVHRSRLERVGLEDQLIPLLQAALTAAKAATTGTNAKIAGALGPLIASYRPDLDADEDLAELRFDEIITAMGNDVDLLLAETISSTQEARGILRATTKSERPTWLAFSVDDFDGTRLRSGEPLQDILPLVEGKAQAILINCSRPEVIQDALPILATANIPFGAYANGFTKISDGFKSDFPTVDALTERHDLGPDAYAEFALKWVDQGATILGGCCEVGPAHIREIATRLKSAGHPLT